MMTSRAVDDLAARHELGWSAHALGREGLDEDGACVLRALDGGGSTRSTTWIPSTPPTADFVPSGDQATPPMPPKSTPAVSSRSLSPEASIVQMEPFGHLSVEPSVRMKAMRPMSPG
jgi:hypothetical protein